MSAFAMMLKAVEENKDVCELAEHFCCTHPFSFYLLSPKTGLDAPFAYSLCRPVPVHHSCGDTEAIVRFLLEKRVEAFWSLDWPEVEAARNAGISSCWVGNDESKVTTRVIVERQLWSPDIEGEKTP